MKIQNMTNNKGRVIPNQFVITEEGRGALGNFTVRKIFQSYDSVISKVTEWPDYTRVELDRDKWNYSRTTGRYRNLFLGETKAETEKKIKDGTYILIDLN